MSIVDNYLFQSAYTVLKKAAKQTIPLLPTLTASLRGLQTTSDKIRSELFGEPVTTENIQAVSTKLVEKFVDIDIVDPEGREKTKKALVDCCQFTLQNLIDQTKAVSTKMGLENIDIEMDFSETSLYPRAVGDTILRKRPMISWPTAYLFTNKITINTPISQVPSNEEALKTRKLITDFMIAHELSHIKNCDLTADFALCVTSALANIGIWFFLPYSLTTKAVCAFGTHAILSSVEMIASKYFEFRADKTALNTLGTNKGALLFFEDSLETNPGSDNFDFYHPSDRARLLAAQTWTPKPTITSTTKLTKSSQPTTPS